MTSNVTLHQVLITTKYRPAWVAKHS